jgi:hypothetical protein
VLPELVDSPVWTTLDRENTSHGSAESAPSAFVSRAKPKLSEARPPDVVVGQLVRYTSSKRVLRTDNMSYSMLVVHISECGARNVPCWFIILYPNQLPQLLWVQQAEGNVGMPDERTCDILSCELHDIRGLQS